MPHILGVPTFYGRKVVTLDVINHPLQYEFKNFVTKIRALVFGDLKK